MLSGMLEQLLGAYPALLLLVILAGHHGCSATNNCAPSSCGNITHISYPFRLQTDPISCGLKEYELGCENNRTTLYLQRVKYYVQAIDYDLGFIIRLVDADFQKDDCLSIPRHSSNAFDYDHYYPFSYGFSISTLTLISCPNPIPSPPFQFVNTSSCKNGSIYSRSSRHMEGYSYLMVGGDVKIAEVPDLCRIDLIYKTTLFFQLENITLIEVHDILAYGFELSWKEAACDYFKENHLNFDINYCSPGNNAPIIAAIAFLVDRKLAYLASWRLSRYLEDGYLIQYDSFGKPRLELNYYIGNGIYATKTIYSEFSIILIVLLVTLLDLIVIYHTILFLCGLPCLITLLIYIRRRRHLSMYDNIEEFLQSDDHNLIPIRYSYSEIKKITNRFNDKLGEGGYGSVYKGKLRSGRLAAVNNLRQEKTKGQDFINEVATIGRIHHCNVVQLIGFTAEGSKRALVYEFMLNGSLEKYIFFQTR